MAFDDIPFKDIFVCYHAQEYTQISSKRQHNRNENLKRSPVLGTRMKTWRRFSVYTAEQANELNIFLIIDFEKKKRENCAKCFEAKWDWFFFLHPSLCIWLVRLWPKSSFSTSECVQLAPFSLLAALLLLVPFLYQWMMLCFVSLCENVQTIFIILHTQLHRHSALRRHREKLLSAHNRQTGENVSMLCSSMMESQDRLKTGGKTYANSKKLFSAFFFYLHCILFIPRHVRRNEREWWQRGWWKKYHCLIFLLLIYVKSLSFSLLRAHSMYKLISYASGALRTFFFAPLPANRDLWTRCCFWKKIKVIKIIQMRRSKRKIYLEKGAFSTHCW